MCPPSAADPFNYTNDKRSDMEKAITKAKTYDIYKDFPKLPPVTKAQYTPSRILVTGAAGFIASHVCIRLARLYPNYRVVGIDKISYCSDEKYVTESLADCPNFRFVKADICDYDTVYNLCLEEKIDTIMHLAAQSHVDLSFKEGGPRQFVLDNVTGTATLLEIGRKIKVGRFVHCSTDEVYGEGSFENRVDFDEDAKLEPNNPYSASKAGADVLAQSFFKSFKFPVVITRGNNVYGPHQFYEKVIPKFIAQLKTGTKLTIHGAGGTTRNFLHVQDTASAFDRVLHCAVDGEAYNIGGKNEKSVMHVAADLLLCMGLESKKQELVSYVPDRAHNDACYPITNNKLCALGWQEQHSWEFGLANTVSYFLDRLAKENRDISKVIQAHPEHTASGNTSQFAAAAASSPPRSRL
mmetsp:Transcript_31983/g.74934  ORF Transcript_31983/g.74934 Transcript_31983/m.74934 type:complete len:410 (+) Transcript_31983:80-1309(+)